MRYDWDYEISYGYRGVAGGRVGGGRGEGEYDQLTSGGPAAGRGAGADAHGSQLLMNRAFHERLEQDLRAQVDSGAAVRMQQHQHKQMIYGEYMSGVSFPLQALEEDSLPAGFRHHAGIVSSNGEDYDIYQQPLDNGVDDREAAPLVSMGDIGASSHFVHDGEADIMDHRMNIQRLFEESSLQPRKLHDESASASIMFTASDQAVVTRSYTTAGMRTDCTRFVPSDYMLEAASATASSLAVTHSDLLLSPSPAAVMVQTVPCLNTPKHSSSTSVAASRSRSGSLDRHDGDASVLAGTNIAFHENSQATVHRRDQSSCALDQCAEGRAGDEIMQGSSELLRGVKRVRITHEDVETTETTFLQQQADVQPQQLKKSKMQQQNSERMTSQGSRSKRSVDQTEHIERERQRRDNMSSRFSTLETLLPPGPKRDRSTIVDDSIQYVKNLHHQIAILRQKRSQLKLMSVAAAAAAAASSSPTSCVAGSAANRIDNACTTAAPISAPKSSILGNLSNSTDTKMPDQNGSLEGGSQEMIIDPDQQQLRRLRPAAMENMTVLSNVGSAPPDSSCKLDVFMDLPEQVVIEMVYQLPRPHIQSQILRAVESLGLDICHCSLNKLVRLRVVYVIVAKPRVVTNCAVSYDDIVEALKCALVGVPSDNVTTSMINTAKLETSR